MRVVVANVHRKGILKLNIHRHGVTFHRSLSSGFNCTQACNLEACRTPKSFVVTLSHKPQTKEYPLDDLVLLHRWY